MQHATDEMSSAERDLRTAALNSNSSLKLLASIAERLNAANPKPPRPSGFAGAGQFLAAVRRLRKDAVEDPRLMVNAVTTWAGEKVGADGGHALPAQFRDEILTPVIGSGSLLGAFSPVPVASDILRIALDETAEWATAGITAVLLEEGTAITPSKAVLKLASVPLYKVPALEFASGELINRSQGYQTFVWRALSRKIKNKVEAFLLQGTGMDQPLGLLNGPALVTISKESAQAAATINAANVTKMVARLLAGSFTASIWIAHSTSLVQVGQLGAGIYNPNGNGPYGTLLGRPLYVSEHCNPLGSLGDLILCDPQGYAYGLDGPYEAATIGFAFDQDLDAFRATLYMGGAPLLSAPVARRTGTDTMSHCVVLEARP
jgi:HK97 family phage major capsid protein